MRLRKLIGIVLAAAMAANAFSTEHRVTSTEYQYRNSLLRAQCSVLDLSAQALAPSVSSVQVPNDWLAARLNRKTAEIAEFGVRKGSSQDLVLQLLIRGWRYKEIAEKLVRYSNLFRVPTTQGSVRQAAFNYRRGHLHLKGGELVDFLFALLQHPDAPRTPDPITELALQWVESLENRFKPVVGAALKGARSYRSIMERTGLQIITVRDYINQMNSDLSVICRDSQVLKQYDYRPHFWWVAVNVSLERQRFGGAA